MSKHTRYEVRGPHMDRGTGSDARPWSVWDRDRDCPIGYYPTREYARDVKREVEAEDAKPKLTTEQARAIARVMYAVQQRRDAGTD